MGLLYWKVVGSQRLCFAGEGLATVVVAVEWLNRDASFEFVAGVNTRIF
jgi:hypothetical protein